MKSVSITKAFMNHLRSLPSVKKDIADQKRGAELCAAREYLKDRQQTLSQELKAKKKDKVEITFLRERIKEAKRDITRLQKQIVAEKRKAQSDEPVTLFKAAKKIERWTDVVAYDPPNKKVRVLFMEDGWEDFLVMDVDGPAHGKQVAKRFMEDGEVPEEAYL